MIAPIKQIPVINLNCMQFAFIGVVCITIASAADTVISPAKKVAFHCEIINQAECLSLAGLKSDIVQVDFDLAEGINSILQRLARLGYPLAGVDSFTNQRSTDKDLFDVYFDIGLPLLADSIEAYQLESGKLIPDQGIKSGIVSSYFLADEAHRLLDSYANAGFPFAIVTIVPSNIILEDRSLSTEMSFEIDLGSYIRIGSVKFPGRSYTTEKLLTNESRIHRGAVFNQAFINRALTRLNKLDYINQTEPIRLLHSSPGIIDLHIPVVENKISTFTGIAAYDPQDKKLRGDANISLGNIFGTGRKLDFIWEGLDPQRNGVSVVYVEPWLLGFPLQAEIGVDIWSGDSIGVHFNRHIGLDWQPDFNLTVGAAIKLENLNPPSSNSTDEGYRSVWLTGSGSFNYLDSDWNPRKGVHISTQTSAGFRRSTSKNSESWTLHHEKISLRYIKEVHPKFIISAFGKAEDISGKRLTYADLISIGGVNSLRGYAEGRNLVRGAYIQNTELRWRLDDSAYLGIFNDVGWMYRKDSRHQVDDWLASFGLTIAIQSEAVRSIINIGLAKGEPLQAARLHVRIRRFF